MILFQNVMLTVDKVLLNSRNTQKSFKLPTGFTYSEFGLLITQTSQKGSYLREISSFSANFAYFAITQVNCFFVCIRICTGIYIDDSILSDIYGYI